MTDVPEPAPATLPPVRAPGRWFAILSVIIVVLALAVAGLAFAIYTGAFTPRPAANAQIATNVPAAPTATGDTPANDTAAAGAAPAATTSPQLKVVDQKDFGDWRYLCVAPSEGGASTCSIMQQLVDSKSGAAIFVWRIMKNSDGGLTAIWQTPEGVLLTRGLTLDAGTPKPVGIPFETCGNGRCQAVANLAADFIETLSKSQKITVGIVRSDGAGATLPVSTNGLSDGLAALQPVASSASAPSAAN